jgi:hypothetical protein
MSLTPTQSIDFRVKLDKEVSYVEPAATVAYGTYKSVVQVPINTLNQSVSLAALFPALTSANAVALTLREVSPVPVGFNFAASNTDPGFPVRPGSIAAIGISSFPPLYIDNASLTNVLDIEITVSGS